MKSRKMSMPKRLKQYFYKISRVAMLNQKYRWGLDKLEKYANKYELSNNEKYSLGMLYDHLGAKIKETRQTTLKKKRLVKNYLKKAETFYREILKSDPNHMHALYGIGRIRSINNNISSAIKYHIRAYHEMLKLPRNQRGGFAIGGHYETLGNLKNAERWFLREYRECQKNDFTAILNLFYFYKRQKRYSDSLLFAKKLEKLILVEFKKNQYKGLRAANSYSIKQVGKEIAEVKKLAQ